MFFTRAVIYFLVSSGLAGGTIYTVTNLGGLGGTSSVATAINNSGEIAGYALTPSGDQHAFVSNNGAALVDLSGSSSPWASANGINSSGVISGTIFGSDGPHAVVWTPAGSTDLGPGTYASGISNSGDIVGSNGHAFLYTQSGFQDLGTLGGSASMSTGMNDAGTIVGDSTTASGAMRGFIWTPSTGMVAIDTLGGRDSHATSVNNAGEVVGQAGLADGYQHAFLLADGVMTDLGTLGGSSSYAYDIGAGGSVVGYSWLSGNTATHAFLWTNGVMVDLNSLISADSGWVLTEAYAINSSGQIVGTGIYHGLSEAFLLNPLNFSAQGPASVPDPATELLVGFGIGMIALFRRTFKN